MNGAGVSPLTVWGNFYVIVGSSSAAFIGLMVIVSRVGRWAQVDQIQQRLLRCSDERLLGVMELDALVAKEQLDLDVLKKKGAASVCPRRWALGNDAHGYWHTFGNQAMKCQGRLATDIRRAHHAVGH